MASPYRRVVIWHQEGDPNTHCCLNCPSGSAIPEQDRLYYEDRNKILCRKCSDLIMAGECERGEVPPTAPDDPSSA